jgi:hypothetical protein
MFKGNAKVLFNMYDKNLLNHKVHIFLSTLHEQQENVFLNLKSDICTGKFLILLYCKNIHHQTLKHNYL